jgi:hypothetical protein
MVGCFTGHLQDWSCPSLRKTFACQMVRLLNVQHFFAQSDETNCWVSPNLMGPDAWSAVQWRRTLDAVVQIGSPHETLQHICTVPKLSLSSKTKTSRQQSALVLRTLCTVIQCIPGMQVPQPFAAFYHRSSRPLLQEVDPLILLAQPATRPAVGSKPHSSPPAAVCPQCFEQPTPIA